MAAKEGYCVKCKAKKEIKDRSGHHDEERPPGHSGSVP